ncbi:BspA family leucine-rich repeat surface protein [Mycoplasma cottewii]|uniref:BspA family leucine-rich repeat surface protein n=1 Tax=Mycoplasma cottewii TaxID=51364 RepID=A0ABY5TXM2_9MOLU|nr:BspA family leucine-rich repeat surface protein [Mycoplasma cottewii]UWD35114.1 BspA family leucine-rich repeat surface protein [Mycoplasma cottewii]
MKKVIRWCILLVFCSFVFFEYWYLLDNFVAFSIKGTKDGKEFILSSTSSNFISEWNDLLKCNFNVFTPISDWKEFIKYEGYELTGFIFGNTSYFAFLEKLKYIIGSVVVFVIVNIYRITVYKTFKNIKNYFINRKDFVAYGYKETIEYLKKFKYKIENSKDISKDDIIKMCKDYKEHKDAKLLCKPIFVSDLIDEVLENTISERNDLSLYIPVFHEVIKLAKEMYYKEKIKIKNSNKFEEWISGIIVSFRYFSHISREYYQYRCRINQIYETDVRFNFKLNITNYFLFGVVNSHFLFFITLLFFPSFFIFLYSLLFIINIGSVGFIVITWFVVYLIIVLFFQLLRYYDIYSERKESYLWNKSNSAKLQNKKPLFWWINFIFLFLPYSVTLSLPLCIIHINKLGYNLISEKYTPNWLASLYIIFVCILLISYAVDFIDETLIYKKYTQKVIYKIWFIEYFVIISVSLIVLVFYWLCTVIKDKETVGYFLWVCRVLLHTSVFLIFVNRPLMIKIEKFHKWKNKIINRLNKIMKNKKIPIYNYDQTECVKIGYYKKGEVIRIKPFPKTIRKVPKKLPTEITSLKGAFEGNINKTIENLNNWKTSKIVDMSYMFNKALQFNGDISKWNTSRVTNMECMFRDAPLFNQNINTKIVNNPNGSSYTAWDVSKVTNMNSMFEYAKNFNQDISNWNTQNVTNMDSMFAYAKKFNQYIGEWDTSKVTNMNSMFEYAKNFNQNINTKIVNNPNGSSYTAWDVSKVTKMSSMFQEAFIFNQPLDNWNTSNVTDMSQMFYNTITFNQDISNWNTSSVTTMRSMFAHAKKFNQNINTKVVNNPNGSSYTAWDVSKVTNMSFMFYDCIEFNGDILNWEFNCEVRIRYMLSYAKNFKKDIRIINDKKTKKALHLSGKRSSKKTDLKWKKIMLPILQIFEIFCFCAPGVLIMLIGAFNFIGTFLYTFILI